MTGSEGINSIPPTYLLLEITFQPVSPGWSDILIAELAEIGFDSFNEEETMLLAYIPEADFDEMAIHDVVQKYPELRDLFWRVTRIPEENWNAIWENSYEPVLIAGRCYIRAPFHPPLKAMSHEAQGTKVEGRGSWVMGRGVDRPASGIRHSYHCEARSDAAAVSVFEIVIEPKMSFGTAHHETTSLMIESLLEEDVTNKAVLDMGCGTGVLAILASKMGAGLVVAIDFDERAVDNAIENVAKNNTGTIDVIKGDSSDIPKEPFDVILANINRNTLMEQIPVYANTLGAGGRLFLSGFYTEDLPSIEGHALAFGLRLTDSRSKNNWIIAKFNR